MSDIRFYHLERSTLEQALPALVNKALQMGHRIVIKAANDQEAEKLNTHLWTYDPNSFIPHGTKKDGNSADQPVWITTEDENPNKADVLILTQGQESDSLGDYALVCEMLNGNDENAVTTARRRWKIYKDAGHDITYWQQGAKGWEKKA